MIINYFLVRTFIFFIIFWYLQYMPQNLFLKQPCRDIYLSVVFYMMWILLQLLYCRMCLSATYQKTKFLPWVKLLVWFSWAAGTILVCCAGLITLCVCVCVCVRPGQSSGGHAAPPVQPCAAGREEQQHGADGGRRTGGRDPGTPPEEPLCPRRPAQQGQQMWALTCDESGWNDAW